MARKLGISRRPTGYLEICSRRARFDRPTIYPNVWILSVKLILLTTVDLQSRRNVELERLLPSVALSPPAREGRLLHLLLCQRASIQDAEEIGNRFKFVEAHASAERVSLSHARNLLLSSKRAASELKEDGIVGFPDDDAWYPAGFLENLLAALEKEKAPFFFCRYGSAPQSWTSEHLSQLRFASLREVVAHASSNTIFLRTSLARAVGAFDENLGIGTSIKSGEDTDYAIRAFRADPHAIWIDAPMVGHRDTNKTLRSNYYAGDRLSWRDTRE